MYKIENYLITHGYTLENSNNNLIIYTNNEDTQVWLNPARRLWEISSLGPYIISIGTDEPDSNFAEFHAQLVKDYIYNYLFKLRQDLLQLKNPWDIMEVE